MRGKKLAYFISGHGFGHATRALAVMDALWDLNHDLHFEIFTHVPEWFFKCHPGSFSFKLHHIRVDAGLEQANALVEDLDKSRQTIQAFFPFQDSLVRELRHRLVALKVSAVISDIAPIGLELASQLQIPSVLIENFTWDMIYKGYPYLNRECGPQIAFLEDVFKKATLRITTEPYCEKKENAVIIGPISRKVRPLFPRCLPDLDPRKPAILLTMGGFSSGIDFSKIKHLMDFQFVMTGTNTGHNNPQNSITWLDPSRLYFPNLVAEVDAIIGKAGYSTASEAFQCSKPFGMVPREKFIEAKCIEQFLLTAGLGILFDPEPENWDIAKILNLLNQNKKPMPAVSGADMAARHIRSHLAC